MKTINMLRFVGLGFFCLTICFCLIGCGKKESAIDEFIVTYDYNFKYDVSAMFDNPQDFQKIKVGHWITDMPKIKAKYAKYFGGWYMKGSNKQIQENDLIGGDVELQAKWNKIPLGVYDENGLVSIIDDVVSNTDESKLYNGVLLLGNGYGQNIKGIFNEVQLQDNTRYGDFRYINTKSFSVSDNNQDFQCIDGIVFNIDLTEIISFPSEKQLNNYIIPDSVTTITYPAFEQSKYLKTITLGKNISSINNSTSRFRFGNNVLFCENLKNIFVDESNLYFSSIAGVLFDKDTSTLIAYPVNKLDYTYLIPSSVTKISDYAFANNYNLSEIIFSDSITEISDYAFYKCKHLSKVDINSNLKTIGNGSFQNCLELTFITLNSNLQRLGSSAFYNCSKLASIELNSSLNEIGEYCFYYCQSLTELTLSDDLKQIGTCILAGCSENIVVRMPPNTNWKCASYEGLRGIIYHNLTIDADGLNGEIDGEILSVKDILSNYLYYQRNI